MKKKWFVVIGILCLLGVVTVWLFPHKKTPPPHTALPQAVTVTAARYVNKPLTIEVLGNVVVPQTVMIKSKLSGEITAIYFHGGQHVVEHQKLIQLDDTAQRAALAEKTANRLSIETQYHRYLALNKRSPGAISADTLSQTQQSLAAAKAQEAAARDTLSSTTIRAPFSGTLSDALPTTSTISVNGVQQTQNTQLTVGAFLAAEQAIAILSNTDKVWVQFPIPRQYGKDIQLGQAVTLTAASLQHAQQIGHVISYSPVVFANNQAFQVTAQLTHPNPLLKSGMRVFVTQTIKDNHPVLVVPGIALIPAIDGFHVYQVVDGRVASVPVKIGERYDTWVGIQQGLKAGDPVITGGINSVQPGSHVRVVSP